MFASQWKEGLGAKTAVAFLCCKVFSLWRRVLGIISVGSGWEVPSVRQVLQKMAEYGVKTQYM
jgi:hypothetical protein